METLFLETGGSLQVKLHPLVLFSILDHYARRQESQTRVIGTLLGSVHGGIVEIVNCFPVPHVENETVAVGKDFNKGMLALHHRVNPKEQIVGWYATTVDEETISQFSCLVHDFYGGECARPVHLAVDTSLNQPRLDVKAFVSQPLSVAKNVIVKFQQVKTEITTSKAEEIGLNAMLKSRSTVSMSSDVKSLRETMTQLLHLLRTVTSYVDDVVAGRAAPDVAVGRKISDVLASVPAVDPTVFEKMFNESLQDLLMVVYLSQLTRTQLKIAEKLTTARK